MKTLLVSLITSLGTVLLPRLSYYIEKKDKGAFQRMVVKAFNFVMIIGISVSVYFTFMAPEAIQLLAGESYGASVLPMQILMPAVLFIGLSNITGIQILTPQGEEKKVLYSIIWGALLDFVLNLFLIGKYGATGAAFATLLAEFVVLAVQCMYLKKMLGQIVKEISVRENLVAALVASVVMLLMKHTIAFSTFVELVITAVLFFGLYGVILLVQREQITVEMVKMGITILKRKGK